MAEEHLRIGCGCGFWGDSAAGPAQLVARGDIDVAGARLSVRDYPVAAGDSAAQAARAWRHTPDSSSGRSCGRSRPDCGPQDQGDRERGRRQSARLRWQCGPALRELGVQLSIAPSWWAMMSALSLRRCATRCPRYRERATPAAADGQRQRLPWRFLRSPQRWRAVPTSSATGRCADSALTLAPRFTPSAGAPRISISSPWGAWQDTSSSVGRRPPAA